MVLKMTHAIDPKRNGMHIIAMLSELIGMPGPPKLKK